MIATLSFTDSKKLGRVAARLLTVCSKSWDGISFFLENNGTRTRLTVTGRFMDACLYGYFFFPGRFMDKDAFANRATRPDENMFIQVRLFHSLFILVGSSLTLPASKK